MRNETSLRKQSWSLDHRLKSLTAVSAMASWSEDHFLCSICLDIFTDPVTAPCGHSFCKTCIDKHWDNSDQSQCPLCKEDFNPRPQLKTSTVLSEMVAQFKQKPKDEVVESSEKQELGADEVLCDVCSESKALKSCLVCLASFCQSHLDPHLTIARLRRHQLIKPTKHLEDRLCPDHDKSLELFCRDDSKCICVECTSVDHKNHNVVPLKEEGEGEQDNVKQMIQERKVKIEEIQKSVEISQKNAEQEMENGVEVFNGLIQCVQQSLDKFKTIIEEKHEKLKEQASGWIQGLEAEILELEKRESEMEELWRSEDHFHFLQTFKSDKPAAAVQDWTEVTPRAPSYEGTAATALVQLRDMLDQEIKEVLEDDLRRLQTFAKEVTLDPDTAHPNLVLSNDNKQVHYSDLKIILPTNPKRFSVCKCVVGKNKVSTGRLYFEVQVKDSTSWYIGMVEESRDRNGSITPNPQNGYWLIWLLNDVYKGCDGIENQLHLKSTPEKIGVFVDYEEGVVSFYDVDTAELIFSFTDCSFSEALLPLFNPKGNTRLKNSAPLVLTPVNK